MMKLAVDARTVYSAERRGTGKNLVDLYRHVAAMRPRWRFVMFHRGQGNDDPFADLANVENRCIEMKGDRFGLWQKVRLPLAARKAGADLLHCPANTGPRWPMAPMVLTIHDLIPLETQFVTQESRAWGRNVAAAAQKARRILTPSAYSKGQIVETFKIDADKIVVNPWAPDSKYRKVTDTDRLRRVRARYGLGEDQAYVLSFSGNDPRKNTERIVLAYAGLPKGLREGYALLVVGTREPLLSDVRQVVSDLGVGETCILHGYAAEEDMAALLSGATALCYPSLSEGFGLPVVDAFVCETAVLTSNRTSLPEVAGDAAVLVEPEDEGAITEGLARLLEDDGLRRGLVEKGRQRLKAYTWDACAARACRTFEEALEEAD